MHHVTPERPRWRQTFKSNSVEKSWEVQLRHAPSDVLIAELTARITPQPDRHRRTLTTERLEGGSYVAAEYGRSGGNTLGQGSYRFAIGELIEFLLTRTSPDDKVEICIRGGVR